MKLKPPDDSFKRFRRHASFLMSRLGAAGAVLAVSLLVTGCAAPPMWHDVHTDVKPWTHTAFRAGDNTLRFAIVADRAGGHRPAVFPGAVEKLNLLQPEFVISVGDFIEGDTEDPSKLAGQRDEFDRIVNGLDAPFFYVPGNHDVSNTFMADDWQRRYGRRYYSFIRKNALFLCLDSHDGSPIPGNNATMPGLNEEQVAWAKDTLRRCRNVRWTFVFMHRPLWLYEEHSQTKGYTGFPELEKALADRPYTVVAGHEHRYTKYVRHERTYLILATTGAASELNGVTAGEFDHVVWVAMTPEGPRIANILLDGVFDENVCTETELAFAQELKFRDVRESANERKVTFALPVENPFAQDVTGRLRWDLAQDTGWTLTPRAVETTVHPGEKEVVLFDANWTGSALPLPSLVGEFATAKGIVARLKLPVPMNMEAYLGAHRPAVSVSRVAQPPLIDGNLGDVAWDRPPDASAFWAMQFERPKAPTEAWLACDATYLYVAVRCVEPDMDKLRAVATKRDGPVWWDDAMEVILDAKLDGKTYHQFIVNCAGVVYDSYSGDPSFTADLRTATAKRSDSWSMELAVPWKDLGVDPPTAGAKMGFVLVRDRAHTSEVLQYPPLNGGNLVVRNYGILLFHE